MQLWRAVRAAGHAAGPNRTGVAVQNERRAPLQPIFDASWRRDALAGKSEAVERLAEGDWQGGFDDLQRKARAIAAPAPAPR